MMRPQSEPWRIHGHRVHPGGYMAPDMATECIPEDTWPQNASLGIHGQRMHPWGYMAKECIPGDTWPECIPDDTWPQIRDVWPHSASTRIHGQSAFTRIHGHRVHPRGCTATEYILEDWGGYMRLMPDYLSYQNHQECAYRIH